MRTTTTRPFPARLASVPAFPPIAMRLMRALGQKHVNLAKVAELISSDALFTARVLQYANSVEFGLLRPIHNVRHALLLLGTERARAITLTAATAAYSRAALRTAELRRCWRHTVATAVLTEELGRSCTVFTESAYAAGLMHDVGRLGLLVAYPVEYEQTIRDCARQCLDILDFERDTFGVDHAEAGRWLAERWNLPDEFRLIAGRHHDPCEGAQVSLLRLVHLGCRLADLFQYDVTKPLQSPDFETLMMLLPEAAQDDFMRRIDAVYDRLKQAVHAFDESDRADKPRAQSESTPVFAPPHERYIESEFEVVEPAAASTDSRAEVPRAGPPRRWAAWFRALF